jgi:hypothetical protein
MKFQQKRILVVTHVSLFIPLLFAKQVAKVENTSRWRFALSGEHLFTNSVEDISWYVTTLLHNYMFPINKSNLVLSLYIVLKTVKNVCCKLIKKNRLHQKEAFCPIIVIEKKVWILREKEQRRGGAKREEVKWERVRGESEESKGGKAWRRRAKLGKGAKLGGKRKGQSLEGGAKLGGAKLEGKQSLERSKAWRGGAKLGEGEQSLEFFWQARRVSPSKLGESRNVLRGNWK